jgi:sugar phosphate isomerase/epimerase
VAPDNFTFQTVNGKRFVPMGAFYFDEKHPEIDPMLWMKHFNSEHVRKDFAMARKLGCNTLRIWFYMTVTDPNSDHPCVGTPEDFERFDLILNIARQNGLRLYVGLHLYNSFRQITKDLPLWISACRKLSQRYKDDPTIFCWELDAEAISLIGYENDKEYWLQWLRSRYENDEDNARAWGLSATPDHWRDAVWEEMTTLLHHNTGYDDIRGTKPEMWYLNIFNKPNDAKLYDWQLFREHFYTMKIKQLADAIRQVDTNHLICLDLVCWVFPLVRNPVQAGWGGPYGYAGIDIKAIGRFVDFFGLHTYPMYIPPFTNEWYENLTKDEQIFKRQLRYLETMCRYVRANSGRPVVHSETGWHGGEGDHYGNSEREQVRWCQSLINETKDCAVGWVNWILMDVPSHEKMTLSSGLVTRGIKVKPDTEGINPVGNYLYDGNLPDSKSYKPKAWGRAFAGAVKKAYKDPNFKFTPGKQIKLSKRLLLTGNVRQLDAILKDCLSDENYPCDIILEENH